MGLELVNTNSCKFIIVEDPSTRTVNFCILIYIVMYIIMVNKLILDGERLFYQKFPRGDASKFTFGYNVDDQRKLKYINIYYSQDGGGYLNIIYPKFRINPILTKYLYDSSYPRIWRSGGSIIDLPKGKKQKRVYPINGIDYYYDNFSVEIVLDYSVNNFRIYVNDRDYFMSNLPQLSIKSDYNAECDLKNPYFQSVVGTWIASYACGVSIKHLTFNNDVPKQIISLMRFHIYFTIRRFMRTFEVMDKNQINSLMREHNTGFLKGHYPKWTWQELLHTEDPNCGVTPQYDYRLQNHQGPGSIRDVKNDYKKFIAKSSNGFTRLGLKLLNESIESYLYCILGAKLELNNQY